jgi:hypothetical protein
MANRSLSGYWILLIVGRNHLFRNVDRRLSVDRIGLVQDQVVTLRFSDLGDDFLHAAADTLEDLVSFAVDFALQVLCFSLQVSLPALSLQLEVLQSRLIQGILARLNLVLKFLKLLIKSLDLVLARFVLGFELGLRFLDFGGLDDSKLRVKNGDLELRAESTSEKDSAKREAINHDAGYLL